jgi:peptidoglycan/LPS O-acetylase OafA/YrhL
MQFTQRLFLWIQSNITKISQWIAVLLGDTKEKNTIAVLDGVRAIACIIVLFFHVNVISWGGKTWHAALSPLSNAIVSAIALAGASGVTLFFVLSGFLLFLPYAKALLFDSAWPSARLFYLRRVFRIVPAYYVALFLLTLLLAPEYLQFTHWKDFGLFLIFFMDVPRTYQKINGPFWTLAVEWQFYLLLPLLALAISLLVRRGSLGWRICKLTLCLVGVIAWGILTRYWGRYFTVHPNETFLVPRHVLNIISLFLYGSSGKYLEDFAVGMLICLCYVLAQHMPPTSTLNKSLRRLSPWLCLGGLLLLFVMALWHFNIWFYHYVFHIFDQWIMYYDPLNEILLALGFGLCVMAVLFGTALFKGIFAWPPLRWIGLISFSLYMWHVPLLQYFRAHLSNQFPGWPHIAVYSLYWLWALLTALPVSVLSYVLIERPWMDIGGQFRRGHKKPQGENTAKPPQ